MTREDEETGREEIYLFCTDGLKKGKWREKVVRGEGEKHGGNFPSCAGEGDLFIQSFISISHQPEHKHLEYDNKNSGTRGMCGFVVT